MPKSNLDTIQEHVEADRIRLVQIVSVARSRSTVIGRALGQGTAEDPRIFVNEPFHWKIANADEGFGCLLRSIAPLLGTAAGKLTVVTKNMAGYLNPDAYRGMSSLAVGTVFTIRNPLVQIGSLLERGINDSRGGFGTDTIKQKDLPPYMARLSEVYKSGPDFRMGWADILRHYDEPVDSPVAVVDGDAAVRNPAGTFGEVCSRLGLDYHDGMIGDWSIGDYVNVGGAAGEKPEENAWTRLATVSKGIVPDTAREPLNISTAPADLRKYLSSVAMPAYDRMFAAAVGSDGF